MDFPKRYRVAPGKSVRLDKIDPDDHGGYPDRSAVAARVEINRERIAEAQVKLYAERKRAVLVCLQGMDAAGKDGVVNHILSVMNPLGCRVVSFGVPSAEEQAHDFLWRYHREMPPRGWVGIFNRTHYESVLVEKVHGLVDKTVCEQRYEAINAFERILTDNGMTIIKLLLHISAKEQLARFKDRLEDPLKQWKISEADYQERERWDDYAAALEAALEHTSSKRAPWYVVPANHKWYRDLVVSEIIAETMEALDIAAPQPRVDLGEIRRKYHAAKKEAKRNGGA